MARNGIGTRSTATTEATEKTSARRRKNAHIDQADTPPRSAGIADAGVHTGEDFANLMSALMSDVLSGSISPMVANAAVNAGGKLLKVVEMQYRYGSPKAERAMTLTLAPG